jgi:hypothetical protein
LAYNYTLEDLLSALYPAAPVQVNAVSASRRRVEHGLLSVGLKIHCLGDGSQFTGLVDELGGAPSVLEINHYKHNRASLCLVLPPVGNARTAILLLECIERATRTRIFGSQEIQIQVCSPGRLTPARSALLAISFYLGSDVLRRYTLGDFATTFSDADTLVQSLKEGEQGKRIVLYDVWWGNFDNDFEWWRRRQVNRLHRRQKLPFKGGRTDTLTAKSRIDIRNINLVATLLCHAQYNGYWAGLGTEFEKRMQELLRSHMLDSLLYASWIHASEETKDGDQEFMSALQELMSYAIEDSFRIRKSGTSTAARPGILYEMKMILQEFRSRLISESNKARGQRG